MDVQTEWRIETQCQTWNGGGTNKVALHFLFHVFSIEVRGANSEYKFSTSNFLRAEPKSTDKVIVFEDIAKRVQEKEIEDCDEKEWLFSLACFEGAIRENNRLKIMKPVPKACINFSYLSPPAVLVFDRPVDGEIEIMAHTYREYFKHNDVPVLA